jgi:hypothetical protein
MASLTVPLIVTLTFDQETWFMHMALLIKVVNISMKYNYNPSICVGDMLWTKSLYFIILSDLDLAYINLNYMFHTCSNDNDICVSIPR